MGNLKSLVIFIIGMGSAFGAGSYILKQDRLEQEEKYNKLVEEIGPNGYMSDTDSVFLVNGDLPLPRKAEPIPAPAHQPSIPFTLSDEEIRILREKQSYKGDGSYIYTPGRIVPSREQEIENYIDKHGAELYEKLEDEYGN